MSPRSQEPENNVPLGKYLWAAALAAIAGFGAVYVTLGRPDNAGNGSNGAPTANSQPANPAGGAAESQLGSFVKKAAPEQLTDVEFLGPEGQPLKLSSFKGRVVLLNLWATWCAPCRKEMPSLDRLHKELGSDKFEVVALAVDRGGADAARKFLAEIKIENLKLYVDPTAKVSTSLKALGLPTTILIDKEGREIGRLAGPAEWDGAGAKALIEAALR